MSLIIRVAFLWLFFFALNTKVFGVSVLEGDDVEALVDSEDYEGEDDQLYLPPHLWKRAGFWAPHPSDFNAMRRPTSGSSGQSRTSKKAESNPYHPIPRSVNIGQKNQRSLTPSAEELEGMVEDFRDKRQSPGSFLLLKLGRKKTKSGNRMGRRGRRRH